MIGTAGARRLAWSAWAVAMVLAAAAIVFLILGRSTSPPRGSFGFRGFSALFAVVFGTVGVLITTRQPRNPIGWIALTVAVLSGFQEAANQYAIWAVLQHDPPLALGELAAWVPAWIWIPGTSGAMFILLLFPDGRLLSARWRWVVGLGVTGTVLGAAGFAFGPGPLQNFSPVENPFAIGWGNPLTVAVVGQTVYGLAFVLSAVAVGLRFRRSRGEERQQMKWLVAAGVFLVLTLASSLVAQVLHPAPGGVGFVPSLLVIAGFLSLPVALGFAILKYRLYEIDVVIKKTVIFATVVAVVTAAYLVLVVALPATVLGLGTRVQTWAVLIGVAIGLAVIPIRNRARRFANRIVYGERATPYQALSTFSSRVAETYSVDDVLPRMAQVLAAGTGAASARVLLRVGPELREVAVHGDPTTEEHVAPVVHQGEDLGSLVVSFPANDPIDPQKERLVDDMAKQAGLVLRNVRLIEELKASRQRLVATQDEERRRLERNIHDGAQQQLVALAVKERLAEALIGKDDERARAMLVELQADTGAALEDLRDLARGIYPPLLADKGLAAALEAQARKAMVPTSVEADGIARFGQDVEAAVYFSVLEALQNVSKYANASSATIALRRSNDSLTFEVGDDGVGFDVSTLSYGTGLQGIADRLAALGGSMHVESSPGRGTSIIGQLPTGEDR